MTSSAAVSPASSLPASPSPLLRWADLALLLVAIVWGTSYGVAKGALAYYPVLGFLAVRFLLTTALLAPVALRGTTAAQRWGALRKGLPLGALLLSIFVCETYGVAHTPASRAAFLISLCVVFTPVAEWALMGQRPSRAAWMCVAVSLCGALLLAGGWQGAWSGGDALMLAAAVLRALMACATARAARHVSPSAAPGAAPVPVLLLTTVQSAVVGLGTLALGWALLPQGLPPLPTWAAASGFWWATAYLVLGCTVFALVAQNWALKHTSPSRVGLLTGTEPAWGALFAVAWLGESLGPQGWLGGALVVGAALWMARR